jgi:hypothetical protein
MSQYDKLDALIVARMDMIQTGRLSDVMHGEVRAECERIAVATGREAFRVIDGRLQALRKRGVITFDSMFGWMTPQ